MRPIELVRANTLSDTLEFTRHMFGAMFGKRFVVGKHHRAICDALNRVLDGECRRLIINIAPRYGKTELAVKNFIAMGLAINPRAKFLHLSYSSDLAQDNSVAVKDIVTCEEYMRLFPGTRIKQGCDTKSKWETDAGGGVYATSTLGQITGFGAGLVEEEGGVAEFGGAVVIDDPIKPEDAMSDLLRGKVNQRFETTIRSRVNSRNTPFIIIMQRLHEDDLCGYLMRTEPGVWEVLSLPAIVEEDGSDRPLWEFKHTMEELRRLEETNPFVFQTQYMQHPRPLEGLLYERPFKTYREIPYTVRAVRKNYTDTADTGDDSLCSIDYVETEIGNFVLDVLFSRKPMEETEVQVTAMLARDRISVANIESNNGGRGFARNVESQSRAAGNAETAVRWFHQSGNKEVRLFTRSSEVMNLTYFPEGWEVLWPAFHNELAAMRKVGRNAHDDAADALTGTVEMRGDVLYEWYDDVCEEDGERLIEIHPMLNGKFVYCKALRTAGGVYVEDGMIRDGVTLDVDTDGVVHVEVPRDMMYYVHEFRARHGDVWGRMERAQKSGYMESYKGIVRGWKFRRGEDMAGFMRNLADYDGKEVYEAMYVLCCLAERIKRMG